jgi:hypothetical protein
VLQGFIDEEEWETARRALLHFPLYEVGGRDLALQSAVNQRILRGKGALLPDAVDCLLATFCIQNNVALLHSDPAFEPFERYLGQAPGPRDARILSRWTDTTVSRDVGPPLWLSVRSDAPNAQGAEN